MMYNGSCCIVYCIIISHNIYIYYFILLILTKQASRVSRNTVSAVRSFYLFFADKNDFRSFGNVSIVRNGFEQKLVLVVHKNRVVAVFPPFLYTVRSRTLPGTNLSREEYRKSDSTNRKFAVASISLSY